MDKSFASLDWSLVQSFLAVAEEGSLSAAARRLGASQPTLGRQIRQVEQQLGVTLFHRKPRGLQLSEIGESLLPAAQTMRDSARQMALAAAGQEQQIRGTVRITASIFVSHYILPPIIAKLMREQPDITIELAPNDASENLLFREADIAIRMYRPTQLDVVARHLGDVPLGLFGAADYLDRRGRPQTMEDVLDGHDLIGYDADEQILRGMRQMGLDASRDWFRIRCDNNVVYWELLRAGCGLGFSQVHLAQQDPRVEQVLCDLPVPALPMYLVTHEMLRHTPRMRVVWDALAKGLRPLVS